MKKLVLLLAVVFSVSLLSCGNAKSEATATDSIDSTTVVVEEVIADTIVADSAAVVADSAAVK